MTIAQKIEARAAEKAKLEIAERLLRGHRALSYRRGNKFALT